MSSENSFKIEKCFDNSEQLLIYCILSIIKKYILNNLVCTFFFFSDVLCEVLKSEHFYQLCKSKHFYFSPCINSTNVYKTFI